MTSRLTAVVVVSVVSSAATAKTQVTIVQPVQEDPDFRSFGKVDVDLSGAGLLRTARDPMFPDDNSKLRRTGGGGLGLDGHLVAVFSAIAFHLRGGATMVLQEGATNVRPDGGLEVVLSPRGGLKCAIAGERPMMNDSRLHEVIDYQRCMGGVELGGASEAVPGGRFNYVELGLGFFKEDIQWKFAVAKHAADGWGGGWGPTWSTMMRSNEKRALGLRVDVAGLFLGGTNGALWFKIAVLFGGPAWR